MSEATCGIARRISRISLRSCGLQRSRARGIIMLAPDEKLKLSPRPYLSATERFQTGADTPRDFLERCLADLAALEPKIGAFVHLNLEGARAAADHSTRRWREGRQRSP